MRAQVSPRAASVGAQKCRVAPAASILASLARTAPSGTTTCAGMPRVRAANANAAPWLPEECVTTPRRASSRASVQTALQAPRNLKAPPTCRCSHLKCNCAPASSSSVASRNTGVTRACGPIRAAAARTSARSGNSNSGMLAPALYAARHRFARKIRRHRFDDRRSTGYNRAMRTISESGVTRLADYRPPVWRVPRIELEFDLDIEATEVTARLHLQCDAGPDQALRLDGGLLELLEIM